MQRQDVVWAAAVGFGIDATLSVIFPIANRTYLELTIFEQGAKATAGTGNHAAILSFSLNARLIPHDNSGCRDEAPAKSVLSAKTPPQATALLRIQQIDILVAHNADLWSCVAHLQVGVVTIATGAGAAA